MSNLEAGAPIEDLTEKVIDLPLILEPRELKLTTRSGVTIKRTLPHRDLKKIGPWCFLDAYGPTSEQGAMQVAAHPHTGLQTVTWLFSGRVVHHDSLGSSSTIQPGELNLMTAGRGIAHSEVSSDGDAPLQGIQLWVVLPDFARGRNPDFQHFQELPRFSQDGAEITLFMGEILGRHSRATTYSPLVGAEIKIRGFGSEIPLREDWEYGVLAVSDDVDVDGNIVAKDRLLYVPRGRKRLLIKGKTKACRPTTVVLIGGEPFDEKFVMWWNFIGRSHDEIVEMRNQWQSCDERFPHFYDSIEGRIPAPEMPHTRLTPR